MPKTINTSVDCWAMLPPKPDVEIDTEPPKLLLGTYFVVTARLTVDPTDDDDELDDRPQEHVTVFPPPDDAEQYESLVTVNVVKDTTLHTRVATGQLRLIEALALPVQVRFKRTFESEHQNDTVSGNPNVQLCVKTDAVVKFDVTSSDATKDGLEPLPLE